MDNTLKVVLGALLAVGLVGTVLPRPTGIERIETIVKEVGGSGQTEFFKKFFRGNVTVGGKVTSTTTGVTLASFTLSANELNEETKIIKINPSVDLALALGATTTGRLVPNLGDTAVFYFQNASSTAASAITLSAADASVDLQENEGGNLVLAGSDWGTLTVIRNGFTGTDHVTILWAESQKD